MDQIPTKPSLEISRGRFRADIPYVDRAPSFPAAGSWESWVFRKLVVLFIAVALPLGCTSMMAPTPAFSARNQSPNLFTGDEATFDGGIGTWYSASSGASVSQVTSPVQAGGGALGITTNAQGPLDVFIGSGNGRSNWIAATPGARYTASAYVRAASTGRTVSGIEAFYDSTGKQVGSLFSRPSSDSTSAWTATNQIVGIAPPTAAYVTFGLAVYGTATGEVHYVDSASIASITVSPVALHGPFHTQGNAIYGSDGARVVFRGIHRDGPELPYATFPSDAEIGQARAWFANIVRVPLNESLWVNTCSSAPSNDASYPSKVDAEVQSITSRGMLALLDLHTNVVSDCGASNRQAMADAAHAPAFWSQLANRYKTNPMVAFDLYNEPHDISDGVWLNGGTATYKGVSFQAAGMQKLYDTVRAAGANNLVFITGQLYGSRPATDPVKGTNIVNAAHDYTCAEAAPPNCPATQPYNANLILKSWTAFGTNNPVMVTEFGWPDKNNATFIGNVISGAEANGWGWIAFAWDGTTYGLFDLINLSGGIYQPSPAGMPVVAGLTFNGTGGIRGSATSTTYDTRYTLSATRFLGRAQRQDLVQGARANRTLR